MLQIEMLNADIQKYSDDSKTLGTEIQELHNEAATASADKKAETKVRELQRTEYEAAHKDYTESIDAIGKAVAVLKKQAYDRQQTKTEDKTTLLQTLLSLNKVPETSKRAIESFLSRDSEIQNPDAYGYEFQSTSVIDMLEKLKEKFVDERAELEKTELNQRHAYDLQQQALTTQISEAEASISAKTQAKSQDLQLVATRKGELEDTTTTKADDSKYLEEMTSSCTQKATSFEERQKLRADEIVAIEKAIEILSSDDVKGAAERNLPSMLQKSKVVNLAQLRSNSNDKNPSNQIHVAADSVGLVVQICSHANLVGWILVITVGSELCQVHNFGFL
jgi:hypothetical protein